MHTRLWNVLPFIAGLMLALPGGGEARDAFPGADQARESIDFRSFRDLSFQNRADWDDLAWDGNGIRPAEGRRVARVTSRSVPVPLEQARPFLAVAAVLEGRFPLASEVHVELRASVDGKRWGQWRDASYHGHDGELPRRESGGTLAGELAFFDADVRFVQYRLKMSRSVTGAVPALAGLTLHFISPGETRDTLTTQPLPGSGGHGLQASLPSYVPRSSWGGLSNTGWLSLANVSQLVVHHTVSANHSSDWAATVRSFYNYHVHTLGWSDIGYNWLVAPDGRLFQGRAHRPDGNTNVRGAHVGGHNSYTMGLAYIGTYSSVNPSGAAVESGARLLAWKAEERGINTALIRGHRDYGATSCPGNRLYARLPDTLRPRVQEILDGDTGPDPEPAYETLWHRADAVNARPWYFGNDAQRGLAVSGDRAYVVSRHSQQWGPHVMVHGTGDGSILGNGGASLDTSGITGGTYALNAIDSDAAGAPVAANLVVSLSDSAFRVYYWPSDEAAPIRLIDYQGQAPHRLGDHIAISGSIEAGDATVWAPASNAAVVYRWRMNGETFNHWPDVIHLSDGAAGGSAAVAPLGNGQFLWNAAGEHLRLYEGNGALRGTVPGSVVARDSNAVRYLGRNGDDLWAAVYQFGSDNENARVVRIPASDPAQAGTLAVTTSLAANANANATGDIAIRHTGSAVDVFVLSTNNGLGAYRFGGLDLETKGSLTDAGKPPRRGSPPVDVRELPRGQDGNGPFERRIPEAVMRF